MIHANEPVSFASGEPLYPHFEEMELVLCSRQGVFINHPLMFFYRRHVCITVQRNASGIEALYGIERARKPFGGLVRQSVNQIDVDARDPVFVGPCNGLLDRLGRLDPVDSFLHLFVYILHAKAHACASDRCSGLHSVFRKAPWVGFDANFCIGSHCKSTVNVGAQIGDLFGG